MNDAVKDDCLHYRGDKPCRFKRPCGNCPHFESLGDRTRILIIKCRAQGDVLRTTALLPGLGRKFPRRHITWVVDPESVDLLAGNPFVDRVVPFEPEAVLPLAVQGFDVVISLDKEPGLTALATAARAPQKYGFGLSACGNLMVFNEAASYALRLGIDDELKYRRNLKTYQEIAAEAAEIEYRRDEYVYDPGPEFKGKALEYLKMHGIDTGKPSVGLNTGAGSKFETKLWPREHYLELIQELTSSLQVNVFLLGGKREKDFNSALEKRSARKVFNIGGDHSLAEFAGFISVMNTLVTSDTLGMHLAIALRKNVVALFGPTCPQEIDLYGRGVKLHKSVPCSPCYKRTCPDPVCMKGITPERVLDEIRKTLR
jgi:ADP-heptose:LPS heptosyltransferase